MPVGTDRRRTASSTRHFLCEPNLWLCLPLRDDSCMFETYRYRCYYCESADGARDAITRRPRITQPEEDWESVSIAFLYLRSLSYNPNYGVLRTEQNSCVNKHDGVHVYEIFSRFQPRRFHIPSPSVLITSAIFQLARIIVSTRFCQFELALIH